MGEAYEARFNKAAEAAFRLHAIAIDGQKMMARIADAFNVNWPDLNHRVLSMARKRSEYMRQVAHPGKFEGEHPAVPFMWVALHEGGDAPIAYDPDDETPYYLYRVEPEDEIRLYWSDINDRLAGVILWENDLGFVYSYGLDHVGLANAVNDADVFQDSGMHNVGLV